jgi:hypothetical protein
MLLYWNEYVQGIENDCCLGVKISRNNARERRLILRRCSVVRRRRRLCLWLGHDGFLGMHTHLLQPLRLCRSLQGEVGEKVSTEARCIEDIAATNHGKLRESKAGVEHCRGNGGNQNHAMEVSMSAKTPSLLCAAKTYVPSKTRKVGSTR